VGDQRTIGGGWKVGRCSEDGGVTGWWGGGEGPSRGGVKEEGERKQLLSSPNEGGKKGASIRKKPSKERKGRGLNNRLACKRQRGKGV